MNLRPELCKTIVKPSLNKDLQLFSTYYLTLNQSVLLHQIISTLSMHFHGMLLTDGWLL